MLDDNNYVNIMSKLAMKYTSHIDLKGFKYLTDLIFIIDFNLIFDMIEVYKKVAEMNGTSYYAVERAIRHFRECVDERDETNKSFVVRTMIDLKKGD